MGLIKRKIKRNKKATLVKKGDKAFLSRVNQKKYLACIQHNGTHPFWYQYKEGQPETAFFMTECGEFLTFSEWRRTATELGIFKWSHSSLPREETEEERESIKKGREAIRELLKERGTQIRKRKEQKIIPKEFWACEYCGQTNKSEDGKCINCGASRRHL